MDRDKLTLGAVEEADPSSKMLQLMQSHKGNVGGHEDSVIRVLDISRWSMVRKSPGSIINQSEKDIVKILSQCGENYDKKIRTKGGILV